MVCPLTLLELSCICPDTKEVLLFLTSPDLAHFQLCIYEWKLALGFTVVFYLEALFKVEILCFCRHDNLDGDIFGNFMSSKKNPYKSKPAHMVLGDSLPLVPAWEKVDQLHSPEPGIDMKRTVERTRPKSGLIVRGMMAGPVASSSQVGLPLSVFCRLGSERWALGTAG